ncbi:MAG TPA: RNA polymerase factor sigma-54 [Flavobacteriales bacterium]|nr:RNA polymerase factor sigma-54 [Flavobacteriales bacterium]MBK6552216.1 RNA polymerase factor sigma-54 [Flavobacteriales bacterium]MBK7102702.1 RNA polymerase factor sigma-54 [Flavobacteriales bacterium]MBK7113691.1 RNA polymerase factor sigma-54 [Flavobacteriales bacterium]MBK7482331.1 RNA polymerase factor sigma-54 [Flavobacteriales bacterium]
MLKQGLYHKLQQKLSPQQIQLMKLLQVPTAELEQRVKQEIEENPALEEGEDHAEEDAPTEEQAISESADDGQEENERDEFDLSDYFQDDDTPDYKLSVKNSGPDEEERETPLAGGTTFQDAMKSQLSLRRIDERTAALAEHLIGNLDEDGYLRRDLDAIVNDLAFTQNIQCEVEELAKALKELQSLDPAGVAARDLRECLLIQVKRMPHSLDQRIAEAILDKHFEAFSKKHYDRILDRLEIDEEALKGAIELIVRLNPRPGNTMRDTNKPSQEIIPDFMVMAIDGELELSLNGRNAPELRVSRQYRDMIKEYGRNKKDKDQREALQFIKQKLDSAKWFIDAIKQRQNTLLVTMEAIMEHQREFFLTGDETKLKPMILKDIAERVGLDISTISRVANSKYVQTNYGTLLLKFFFSESLTNDQGEEVSTREVKKILKDAIEAEEKRKPLTDDELTALLKEKGYNIARRTVAKYREQLNIPVARLRKEL